MVYICQRQRQLNTNLHTQLYTHTDTIRPNTCLFSLQIDDWSLSYSSHSFSFVHIFIIIKFQFARWSLIFTFRKTIFHNHLARKWEHRDWHRETEYSLWNESGVCEIDIMTTTATNKKKTLLLLIHSQMVTGCRFDGALVRALVSSS